MNIAAKLDAAIKAVCPIHGVSIGRADDKQTWRIDYADDATAEQREAAQSVLVSFNPDAPIISEFVTMRQARLALLAAGKLEAVTAAVQQVGGAAQIEWEYATEVRRDWPLVVQLTGVLGMTDADMDALFVQAATL